MKCHHCGASLPVDRYIRSGEKFFCAMKPEGYGFSCECFSAWAYSIYPIQLARKTVVELPTPEMTG